VEIEQEEIKSYAKVKFTRQELLEKLGFDSNDAFDVTLNEFGRNGITFTLSEGRGAKYTGNTIDEDIPRKHHWRRRDE
jgi:hypothetical protein